MCSNIPASPAYGDYISQLIRYARACRNFSDFLKRHLHLRNMLLDQGYKKIRLIRSLKKFDEAVSVVSLTSGSGGYINGINSANIKLLIDKTSSIYLVLGHPSIPQHVPFRLCSCFMNTIAQFSTKFKILPLFLGYSL
jgi:hypothetical protein